MKIQLDTAYRAYHEAKIHSGMETKQLVEQDIEKELETGNGRWEGDGKRVDRANKCQMNASNSLR